MRVREYTPADRAACLTVFESNIPTFFVAAERREFEAFLDDLPGPYYVLEDETDTVVGCGGYAVEPGTRTADLCWGMIARASQGSDLGRRLAEVRLARIRGDDSVRDVALTTSQLTRGFYERLGFVAERVVVDGVAPGLDRCEMRLRRSDRRGRTP